MQIVLTSFILKKKDEKKTFLSIKGDGNRWFIRLNKTLNMNILMGRVPKISIVLLLHILFIKVLGEVLRIHLSHIIKIKYDGKRLFNQRFSVRDRSLFYRHSPVLGSEGCFS